MIDEAAFTRLYPGEGGYRYFLIDTPTNQVDAASRTLSRAFQDAGWEVAPAVRRLDRLNAVQNTYLTTFQMLGGLGLLLGSAGLGVVVLRNVLERRGELALLTAVGFRRRQLARGRSSWSTPPCWGSGSRLGLAGRVLAAALDAGPHRGVAAAVPGRDAARGGRPRALDGLGGDPGLAAGSVAGRVARGLTG